MATRYSDDAAFANPFTLIAMVKGIPVVHLDLRAACQRVYEWGPSRMPGEWHLAYLCFVISRIPDIQPWYQRMKNDLEFWEACGFDPDRLPSYRTVHLRFTELEDVAAVFERAAAHLIGIARKRDSRVGCWWHIDATEAETHASPQHDCTARELCPTRRRKTQQTPTMRSVPMDVARAIRQAEAEQPAGSGDAVEYGEYTPQPVAKQFKDPTRKGRRLRLGDHWWYSRDPDAGTRLYSRGDRVIRVWHGYLQIDVVDHLTGGLLCSRLVPADSYEAHAYADVYTATVGNTGVDPLLVAGDKGYSVSDVFRHNTEHGVGSVFPYRRAGKEKGRQGTDRYDAYGIPRCQHCAGDTRFHSFAVDRGMPRLWFRCLLPKQPGCQKVQVMQCDVAPRYLLPVWRNEPAYAAMRHSHQTYEHRHRSARIQYLTAPDTLALRPKRPGIKWQQLRANAAVLIDWLRILRRVGWDGSGVPARVGTVAVTGDGGMPERLDIMRGRRRAKAPPGAKASAPSR
ncbi:MAG TPA: hypothetical protein VF155_11720 [Candidatus Dormibacteraeota bacterium]